MESGVHAEGPLCSGERLVSLRGFLHASRWAPVLASMPSASGRAVAWIVRHPPTLPDACPLPRL